MKRRNFIKASIGVLFAAVCRNKVAAHPYPRSDFGRVPRMSALGVLVRPLLNGVPVKDCFDGDDREGWLLQHAKGDDGHFVFGKFNTLHGVVCFVLNDNATDKEHYLAECKVQSDEYVRLRCGENSANDEELVNS